MSGNSESSDSLLLSSINSSLSPFQPNCFFIMPFSLVFTAYTITILLFLLPLCLLVLYHGLLQWRQQRSRSTAAVARHADSFTYHTVAMEMIFIFGCIVCCGGFYSNRAQIITVGGHLFSFTWYGERFFHILTCMEHYVAVVHPITYLSLRKQKGIRIRNIVTGVIWLLCAGLTSLMSTGKISSKVTICLLTSSLITMSFSSLSVYLVLIRPGPGKQGRDRVRVDQSKQRAFYTIVSILGVLMLRCVCNLVLSILSLLNLETGNCVEFMCDSWINVPSSLLLPLLFLQRAGYCKIRLR